MAELVKVKRERCRGQAELPADLPGGQAIRPGLNEQAENIESRFLRDRGQCGYGVYFSIIPLKWKNRNESIWRLAAQQQCRPALLLTVFL